MRCVLLALALAACTDDGPPRAAPITPPSASRTAADPAQGVTTELDGAAPAFGDGLLAELTGDEPAARAAFEKVLAAPDAPSALAARAALHLAQIESRAGHGGGTSRHTLDLVARAAALAPSDVAIAEGVAQLQADFVAASGTGDIHPQLGIALPGVEPKVAADFAAAERALAAVRRLHPQPFIEALSSSIRLKEDATEEVVAKYRAVAEHGGLAQIAADYRAGSLYHDLALGLLFELPPELNPSIAAALRRTLRASSLTYLRKAVERYQACLAAPVTPDARNDAELWRLAAETDLRGARDVLGEAGQ